MNEMKPLEPHPPDLVKSEPESDAISFREGTRTRPIVVVLGPHRSGTSLTSQVLSALGVDMTDFVNANPLNAKSEWERFGITGLHDQIFELFDRGYHRPQHDLPLPKGWASDARLRSIEQAIRSLLGRRMVEGGPFGFKDPRTSRVLPLWIRILRDLKLTPKFILCLRDPAQVASSLADRNGLDPEVAEYRWFVYMADALTHLRSREVCLIEYEKWFSDFNRNFTKLVKFVSINLGLSEEYISDAASQIVDSYLPHGDSRAVKVRSLVRSLYQLAQNFADSESARSKAIQLINRFAVDRELHLLLHRETESALREELARAEQTAATADEISEAAQSAIDKLREKLTKTEQRASAAEGRLVATEAALAGAQADATARSIALMEAKDREAGIATELRRELACATVDLATRGRALSEATDKLARARNDLERIETQAAQSTQNAGAAQILADLLRAQLAEAENARDLVSEERDQVAEERDRVAEERDRFAEDRDRVAEERDRVAEERDCVAEERDRVAEERDRFAEERDCVAEERDRFAEERDCVAKERDRLVKDRDRIATECDRWFDATILSILGRDARDWSLRGWRISRYMLQITAWRGKGSPMWIADRARDNRRWAQAARFYVDALRQSPDRPHIWVQLGHSLKEAGKIMEAEFAYRNAIKIDNGHLDALVPLGQLMRVQGRNGEAHDAYSKALGRCRAGELRDWICSELRALDCRPGNDY